MLDNSQAAERLQKSYPGSRYFREFVSKIRKDEDAGKYEHLEDYPYDIFVDHELGIRLFHAGINPYDPEHFRHQLYLVVTDEGKASKLCPADTVVAASLTLQWTKRGDLCNALQLSIKSFGQCTFAWSGEKSFNKCGWCGHQMKTCLWRNDKWRWVPYRHGRRLGEGEKHCCRWNKVVKRYECCRCGDPDNAFMTPLDRDEAFALPQSVLPATINPQEGGLMDSHLALVPRSVKTELGQAYGHHPHHQRPIVNNFHFYGNNHMYSGPPNRIFSAIGLEGVPKGLIDLPLTTEGRVQEIEEDDRAGSPRHCHHHPSGPEPDREREPGSRDSSAGRRPTVRYVSPRVEDLDDSPEDARDGGVAAASGVIEEMARLEIADAKT